MTGNEEGGSSLLIPPAESLVEDELFENRERKLKKRPLLELGGCGLDPLPAVLEEEDPDDEEVLFSTPAIFYMSFPRML